MRFISYAQNCEDVLLWRALGHIKNGFYIDVGANDPVEHSVTKAFSDAGWRGINIEPLPAFHQAFMAQRPRDINLAVAAGAVDGSLTLYDVPAVNGWASPDAAVADAHRADGHVVSELTVPVRTLASICREHARADIHFLKVDVEGFEAEVLRGMDFDAFRPWLLVIEATLPNSRVTNHDVWEPLVTSKAYRFAWFDGLNRYYVSEQHPELMEALTVQPNVFDDFISHHLDTAWRNGAAAVADAAGAHARVAQLGELEWKAEQRAERAEQRGEQQAARSDALVAQALANARELLLKYEDAGKRADLANADLDIVRADAKTLRASLARADSELTALDARLRKHDAVAEAARAAQADAQARALAAAQAAHDQQLAHAWAQGELATAWGRDLEQRLLATLGSRSWRVTRPLRALTDWRLALGAALGRFNGAAVRTRALAVMRPVLVAATRDERARRLLIPLMRRLPDRGMGISRALNAIKQPAAPAPTPVPADDALVAAGAAASTAPPDEILHLSAAARKVFADLQHARSTLTS